MSARKDKQFSIRLTKSEKEQLKVISEVTGHNESHCLRLMIEKTFIEISKNENMMKAYNALKKFRGKNGLC